MKIGVNPFHTEDSFGKRHSITEQHFQQIVNISRKTWVFFFFIHCSQFTKVWFIEFNFNKVHQRESIPCRSIIETVYGVEKINRLNLYYNTIYNEYDVTIYTHQLSYKDKWRQFR